MDRRGPSHGKSVHPDEKFTLFLRTASEKLGAGIAVVADRTPIEWELFQAHKGDHGAENVFSRATLRYRADHDGDAKDLPLVDLGNSFSVHTVVRDLECPLETVVRNILETDAMNLGRALRDGAKLSPISVSGEGGLVVDGRLVGAVVYAIDDVVACTVAEIHRCEIVATTGVVAIGGVRISRPYHP